MSDEIKKLASSPELKIYTELIRKGLSQEEAIDLAEKLGSAAQSAGHGHCLPPDPSSIVSNPPR